MELRPFPRFWAQHSDSCGLRNVSQSLLLTACFCSHKRCLPSRPAAVFGVTRGSAGKGEGCQEVLWMKLESATSQAGEHLHAGAISPALT